MPNPTETQVEKLMKALDISREEALQVIEDDKRIDKGEKLFELTAEQKKAQKEARQADRTPTVYKFQKRERKANEPKKEIVQTIVEALVESGKIDDSTLHIENIEREFTFESNGTKYKVVLSCPRK